MRIRKLLSIFSLSLLFISSCADIDEMNSRLDAIEAKLAEMESVVSLVNSNAIAISHALRDSVFLSVTKNDLGYTIETTDGDKIQITDGSKCPSSYVPVIGVTPDDFHSRQCAYCDRRRIKCL